MGYTTELEGEFRVDPPLPPERVRYLRRFNETRRMKRSASALEGVADPIREAVGLPLGPDGAYFVGSDDRYGQDMDHASVVDENRPPSGQPGLWCGWRASDDGSAIRWDGVEKFYYYAEWLQYLVDHFLRP